MRIGSQIMLMKESASFSNLGGRSRDATGRSQESSRQSQPSGDWYQQDNDLISSFDNRASNGNDMDTKSSFRSLTIIPAPLKRAFASLRTTLKDIVPRGRRTR